jgi:hypothetical protein
MCSARFRKICRLISLASVALLSVIHAAAAPPPNDTCAGAVVVPGSAVLPYLTAVITNLSAATTVGDPPPPTNCVAEVFSGIWFSYTPPVAGSYTFSVSGDTATTVLDTAMAIYSSAGNCSGLTLVACNDDEGELRSAINTPLTAGVTYYIVVWGAFSVPEPGSDSVQLRVSRPVVPANDTCANAVIVPPSGPFPYFTPTNDITLATLTGDPPVPTCYPDGRKSVWFRFTPTEGGSYFFTTGTDTATTIYETVMAIYQADTCSGYTQLACNYVLDGRAELTRALTALTRYHIVVWDADTNSPTHGETSLQLGVTRAARPELTTLPATQIASTSARLQGSFTLNSLAGRFWFEYGTTTNYGLRTTPRLINSGTVRPVLTNAVALSLTPGVLYHYRAVATNSLGTNYGTDLTFRWVNTRPQILSFIRQSGGYRLRFSAVSGQVYRVEASENLTSWSEVGTAQDLGGNAFEFLHAASAVPRRFYRVKGI